MKKNKILHILFYNGLTFIVGSFLIYQYVLHLNPKNDYHVNKDMKIFLVMFGFVSILLRNLFVEISNHFSDKRPTMEVAVPDNCHQLHFGFRMNWMP